MRLSVLSSGSGGNCLWVEGGGRRLLVDAGLSLKETVRRCHQAGVSLREVSDVLLTHEHADHCHGAAVLARKLGVRVHATRGTLQALRDKPPAELCFPLAAGTVLELGTLLIHPIAVPHDALEPVCYSFEERTELGSARAAIVTDLGRVTPGVIEGLRGLDALVLEMNHDVRLLLEGPYPYRLKQRIRGGYGHLSNVQGAQLLDEVLHPGLRHVVLAHLSEQNNTPAHARREAAAVLERRGHGAKLVVAAQARALLPVEILPGLGPRLFQRPRQLALFA